jgi:hypothetical protein
MKRRLLAMLVAGALASPVLGGGGSNVQRSAPQKWDGAAKPRGDELLRATLLAAHNQARAAVGLSAMQWDAGLERDAARWANELARRNEMTHSDPDESEGPQGENLWSGTADAYRYDEMVAMWVEERARYIDALLPNVSTTGEWGDVGHYTQIIWRTTTHVGCALASNGRADFLVCRYSPPGNVFRQNAITGTSTCRTSCQKIARRDADAPLALAD